MLSTRCGCARASCSQAGFPLKKRGAREARSSRFGRPHWGIRKSPESRPPEKSGAPGRNCAARKSKAARLPMLSAFSISLQTPCQPPRRAMKWLFFMGNASVLKKLSDQRGAFVRQHAPVGGAVCGKSGILGQPVHAAAAAVLRVISAAPAHIGHGSSVT